MHRKRKFLCEYPQTKGEEQATEATCKRVQISDNKNLQCFHKYIYFKHIYEKYIINIHNLSVCNILMHDFNI